MKKLIALATMTLIATSTAKAGCVLTLDVKKEGAKTAYANGVSVSSKIRDALNAQCEITYKVMTDAEVKAMKIANLERRLAKLKK